MYNIVIVGAGQLGSRHLQGLKLAKLEMSIYLVDPNLNALNIAKERYDAVPLTFVPSKITLLKNINSLPNTLDLVIVATSSLIRADLTKDLIKSKIVRNILFEKFLFPAPKDYEPISDLLSAHQIKAWVNCPRRMFSYFQYLKSIIQDAKFVDFTVSGCSWGLACNSIHFIDIFAYLIQESKYTITALHLNDKILKSKRSGYIEFNGTIKGNFQESQRFTLTSEDGDSISSEIFISTDKYDVSINEAKQILRVRNKHTARVFDRHIHVLYQSQLTGILAEDILLKGFCELVEYQESANLHLEFLEPVLNFYNSVTKQNSEQCPIT